MTTESGQFSPRRSEIKTDALRTPTLDLIDTQSLAEAILQAAGAPTVEGLAAQIVGNCEYADMADVRGYAEEIRGTADEQTRAYWASEIISVVSGMINDRSAQLEAEAAAEAAFYDAA